MGNSNNLNKYTFDRFIKEVKPFENNPENIEVK